MNSSSQFNKFCNCTSTPISQISSEVISRDLCSGCFEFTQCYWNYKQSRYCRGCDKCYHHSADAHICTECSTHSMNRHVKCPSCKGCAVEQGVETEGSYFPPNVVCKKCNIVWYDITCVNTDSSIESS